MLCREYMLSGLAGEQLEATLCVADMANADDAENGMQTIHEYVADQRALYRVEHRPDRQEGSTYLYDRLRLDQVSPTANRDSGCVVRSYLIHSLP